MIRVLVSVASIPLDSEVGRCLANASDIRIVGHLADIATLPYSIRILHPTVLILDDGFPPPCL